MNTIVNVPKFRVFLRDYIYCTCTIDLLSSCIQNELNVKSIDIDNIDKKITIDIEEFKDTQSLVYSINKLYSSLNDSFYNFIIDKDIRKKIESSFSFNDTYDEYILRETYKQLISGDGVSSLYNATPISNSSIVIYL